MSDASGQTAPGWYQAAGDPPDTQRYWNGAQWQGGPQPVGGGGPPPTGQTAAALGVGAAAEYGPRFMAYLIDVAIGAVIAVGGFLLILLAGLVHENLALLVLLAWLVAVVAFSIYNYIYLQGTTGQTIGKKKQGIALLNNKTGEPVGMLMVFVRGILGGLIAQVCLLDYLWMFKGEERVRLSDQILDFQVRQVG